MISHKLKRWLSITSVETCGEVPPRRGLVYRDHNHERLLVAPIPLNILYRAAYLIHFWARRPWNSADREIMRQDAAFWRTRCYRAEQDYAVLRAEYRADLAIAVDRAADIAREEFLDSLIELAAEDFLRLKQNNMGVANDEGTRPRADAGADGHAHHRAPRHSL